MNSWFRMYSEFATDPKVQMMSEIYQRRLTMLFCLRCNGIETFQDEEVTFQLRISNDEWSVTKSEFIERGFIDSNNKILNWGKRQFISDSSTTRVKKHRKRLKHERNVSVTPPDTEQIQITDTEKKEKVLKTKKVSEETKLPDWMPLDDWNAFVEMRAKSKKPLTPRAKELAIAELEKLNATGSTPSDVLRQSVMRGYLGLFEVKKTGPLKKSMSFFEISKTLGELNEPTGNKNFDLSHS